MSEWLRDLDKVEDAAECSYFSNASILPLPVETFDGASGSLNVIIHQDATASATEATKVYQVSIWVLISCLYVSHSTALRRAAVRNAWNYVGSTGNTRRLQTASAGAIYV